VLVPLIAGVLLLVGLIGYEARAPEPMLPLSLFRARNFSVGNMTTFALYGGLSIATFYLVVFIQQVGGYTPLQAGLALLPITLVMFTLSPRWGRLLATVGPRPLMGGGPLVAGCGLLLLTRVGAGAAYLTTVLPGVVVFGLGLSITVAPLTATVLGAVARGHSGVASGVNNAISRIGGLVAIAAVGAAIAGAFQSHLGRDLRGLRVPAPVLAAARARPLVTLAPYAPPAQRAPFHRALVRASVSAFREGMAIAGVLAIAGGLISLAGIAPLPRGQAEHGGKSQGEEGVAAELEALGGQQHGPLDGAADQPDDVTGGDRDEGARLRGGAALDGASAPDDPHAEA
jgi:MFS family permease